MIDLTSLDNTYTNVKIMQIKTMLKDIKPEMKELSSSDVVNMSLIVFAYLCESDCLEKAEDDIILAYCDDELLIDLNDLSMQLKFKNALLNEFLSTIYKHDIDMMKGLETIKELVGDKDGF